jgi:putative ABC transport system ATP-binding protein
MNSSTARAVIDLNNVTKTYASGELSVQALRGVTFSIQPGEYVAIMGPSGSGKSTLMNLLGALDRPTTGTYKLDGADVASLNDNELAAIRLKKLGFIFQGFNLLARTSATKNVALPLFYAGVSPRARNEAAIARLTEVGLADRLTHKPNELSGGQQQRVAIARALVNDPAVLLADEPTGNLDTQTSEEIMALFEALNAAGRTIIMVTHDEDISRHAKRVIRLRDGLVVADELRNQRTIS